MNTTDIIVGLIIIFIITIAGRYIYKAKKRGQTCIGCPYAKECQKNHCNCNQSNIDKN